MNDVNWLGAALRAVYLQINCADEAGPNAAELVRLHAAARFLEDAKKAMRSGGVVVALSKAQAKAVVLAADNMAKDEDALDAYFPNGGERNALFAGLGKLEGRKRT